jgi:hypothetical protein
VSLRVVRGRFGGRAGKIRVYDQAGVTVEEMFAIDERERR